MNQSSRVLINIIQSYFIYFLVFVVLNYLTIDDNTSPDVYGYLILFTLIIFAPIISKLEHATTDVSSHL